MEQIKIEIMSTPQKRIDMEAMRQQRELTDEAVKRGFLASMSKPGGSPVSNRETASPPPALVTGPPVTLRELAERLKMDRSACRRYVLALGYEPLRQRTAESGYQVALTFTPAQADEIFERRRAEGYC